MPTKISGSCNRIVLTFILTALLAFSATPAVPQQAATDTEPTLGQAMARLQANDNAGARKILETVVKRESKNSRAWRALGYACLGDKNSDCAISAYKQSLELEADYPPALYNLAAAYARKGQKDEAIAALAKAKATHKLDMSQLAT